MPDTIRGDFYLDTLFQGSTFVKIASTWQMKTNFQQIKKLLTLGLHID